MTLFVGLITLAVAFSLGSGTIFFAAIPESFFPGETRKTERPEMTGQVAENWPVVQAEGGTAESIHLTRSK